MAKPCTIDEFPHHALHFAALAPPAVLGGGGGFLQVEVKVSPGEKLLVLVGGGGGASHGEAGGAGGFNGGQAGRRVSALPTPLPLPRKEM